jgi:poly(beta-D-mannuronate) lyase
VNRRHIHALGLVWLATFSQATNATDPPITDALHPPFDVAAARAHHGTTPTAFTCPAVPPPVRDLTFGGFYEADSGSSVIDAEAERRYKEAAKPFDDYQKKIAKMSDHYVASNPPQAAAAKCVLAWLDDWGRARAILGKMSAQGGFVRKWGLGVIAVAYLKVRGEPTLDGGIKEGVKIWIRRLAETVRHDYSTNTDRSSRRNNHLYWAAWSVMAAAVALDDHEMFDWSVGRYRFATVQIEDDGTLPLEMVRRSKALHYHLYSIPPLVLIAETGARNGLDLYAEQGGALHRLIGRTVAGLDDPSFFAARSGYEQQWGGTLNAAKLAWMEPYYARFKDRTMIKWIRKFRPLGHTRQGGDQTLLFGTKKLTAE